jgi:predicted nucleic acid-binding protein
VILVDSSVWIDYFNGKVTLQTDWLDDVLETTPIVMGDLILTEVLQGFRSNKEYQVARDLLLTLPFMEMVGRDIAVESAENYRILRKKGVTVRKTMDILIGTFCIHYKLPLLHDDRDFEPMTEFLHLRAIDPTRPVKRG